MAGTPEQAGCLTGPDGTLRQQSYSTRGRRRRAAQPMGSRTQPRRNYGRSLGKPTCSLPSWQRCWSCGRPWGFLYHHQMSTPSERLHETPDSRLGEMTRTVPGGEQWPRCEEATPFSLECSPPWPSAGAADSQRSTLWMTFPHGCDAETHESFDSIFVPGGGLKITCPSDLAEAEAPSGSPCTKLRTQPLFVPLPLPSSCSPTACSRPQRPP